MEELIGLNAGTVWSALHQQGELSFKGLKKATKLKEKELWAAIGWLARESKIRVVEIEDEILLNLA